MSLPRYPAYKDSGVSWLGEVPAHWEVWKLTHAFPVIGSGTTPKSDNDLYYADGDIPWVNTGDLNDGFLSSCKRSVNFFGMREHSSLRLYKAGSVVIAMYGATIGKLAIPVFDFTVNQACCVFDGSVSILPKYLFYWLMSFRSQIVSLATGGGQPNISQEILSALRIAAPAVNEQAEIAGFLDRETAKIDALIAEQEKLIALLAEKRQATISRAVTRGLDPNVPLKDSGVPWLGKVPAHWKACPLRYLAKVGNGSTPSRDNAAYWAETGFPWLNSSVVNQDEVTESDQFVTDLALKECHLPVVTPPAVLMGITGQGKTRGMVAKLGFVATVNQHLAYVKPDAEILNDDFLLRVFESAYEYLRTESDGAGSTKGAITCDQISRLHIPLPEIGEQFQIAAYLNKVTQRFDSLKEEALTAVALLKERRAALISAAVTGKIDVRGLAA